MNRLVAVGSQTIFSLLGFISLAVAQSPMPVPSVPSSIEVRLKSDDRSPWHEWYDPSAVLGVVGVLGGLAGVLIQRYWHRIDERLAKTRCHAIRRPGS